MASAKAATDAPELAEGDGAAGEESLSTADAIRGFKYFLKTCTASFCVCSSIPVGPPRDHGDRTSPFAATSLRMPAQQHCDSFRSREMAFYNA